MIDEYFESIDKIIMDFKAVIGSYNIFKKAYNEKQGYIKGEVFFKDCSKLYFIEVKNTELKQKIKYRYHYMDNDNGLIFRYDNAYHHREVKTFPDHKHIGGNILDSHEPELYEILIKIQQHQRGTKK
jgi:hypothetical protein